jgi:hypothetical protein
VRSERWYRGIMEMCLNHVCAPVAWALLRKGSRVFALLGKVSPAGLAPFGRSDLANGWALTAEFGCLRLERLSGAEELTGGHLVLPTAGCYDYGVAGVPSSPELVRAIFGLLPSELEELVTVLRRGGFPVLGFSRGDLTCSISACVIPAYWPHVVTSNMSVCGNILSLETFVRIMVSSIGPGRLALRFPGLEPVLRPMVRLVIAYRRGLPYHRESLALAPSPAPTAL